MALIDIPQYRSELAEIRKSLLAAGDALHIDHIREQLDELTEEMNQPEFWNDPDHSAKVNQKVSNLKNKLEHYEKLLSSADDIEVMLEMAEEEKDEDTVTEAVDELATLKEHTWSPLTSKVTDLMPASSPSSKSSSLTVKPIFSQ